MKLIRKILFTGIVLAFASTGKNLNAQHLFMKGAFYIAPGSGGGIGSQLALAAEGRFTKKFSAQLSYTHYYMCHYDCVAKNSIIPEIRYYVYKAGMFEGYVNTSYSYTIESVDPEEGDFYENYINSVGLGFGNRFIFSDWVSMELGISPLLTTGNYDRRWRRGLRFTVFMVFKVL